MTFFKWSRTAATNGLADSTCPFPEGMAPSALNDGTRGMMAAAAKYRDDTAGAIVTGGTSTAYTVSSYEGFGSLSDLAGQVIAFSPHATSGATVTLNVDGLGAKPLRSAPGVDLPAGVLIQGTPYTGLYNAADQVFYLHGLFGNPYSIPIGGLMDYIAPTTPNSSFVFPIGQAISRTTYATLFAMIGTTYGTGDGSTTFNIPDLTGRVVAMKEAAATRLTATYFGGNSANLGAVGGAESHLLTTSEIPSHQHNVYLKDPGHIHSVGPGTGLVAGTAFQAPGGGSVTTQALSAGSNTTGMTIGSVNGVANDNLTAASGGGAAHAIVQPTIVLNKILRII